MVYVQCLRPIPGLEGPLAAHAASEPRVVCMASPGDPRDPEPGGAKHGANLERSVKV